MLLVKLHLWDFRGDGLSSLQQNALISCYGYNSFLVVTAWRGYDVSTIQWLMQWDLYLDDWVIFWRSVDIQNVVAIAVKSLLA